MNWQTKLDVYYIFFFICSIITFLVGYDFTISFADLSTLSKIWLVFYCLLGILGIPILSGLKDE